MDSNQFFKNKINAIKPENNILETIKSWKNKTYKRGLRRFQLTKIEQVPVSDDWDILCHNLPNFKAYRITTTLIGSYEIPMRILLDNTYIIRISY